MPFIPFVAGYGIHLPHDAAVSERDFNSDYESARNDYQQTSNAVSGGIIAVIVIVVVLVVAFCIGGLCQYNRTQQRRQARQAELQKWQANHPNPVYGGSTTAPTTFGTSSPPSYPHAVHTYHHHSHTTSQCHAADASATNNVAMNNATMGFSSSGGGMSGTGGI
jgi:nitrate reductase cytochrome c-type subunit